MPSRLRSQSTPGISFFSFQDIITSVTGILVLVTLILTLYLKDSAPGSPEIQSLRRRRDAAREQLEKVDARNEAAARSPSISDIPPDPSRLQSEIREWQEHIDTLSSRLAAAKRRSNEQTRDSENKAEQLGLAEVREQAGSIQRDLQARQQSNTVLVTESASLEGLERELRKKIEAATNQHRLWLLPDVGAAARQPVLVTVSRTNVVCERFNQPAQRRVFSADQAPSLLATALREWQPSRDYIVFYVRPSGIEAFIRLLELAKSAGFQVGYDAVEENKEIVFSTPAPP